MRQKINQCDLRQDPASVLEQYDMMEPHIDAHLIYLSHTALLLMNNIGHQLNPFFMQVYIVVWFSSFFVLHHTA